MSTQRELLEKALCEILHIYRLAGLINRPDVCEAIEAELAKPEQEPVGEIYKITSFENCLKRVVIWNGEIPSIGTKLYTSPPQYKPLSDDDIKEVIFDMFGLHGDKAYELKILIGNDLPGFARAIEKRITEGK